jgi:hypothetical protein
MIEASRRAPAYRCSYEIIGDPLGPGRLPVTTTGWKLEPASREFLLDIFPPHWCDLIADHVTLDGKAPVDATLPSKAEAKVIGHADDGKGLETLVVTIGGNVRRPDGGIFHITWSLDRHRDREAVESNDLITRHGWRPLAVPITIDLLPALLE